MTTISTQVTCPYLVEAAISEAVTCPCLVEAAIPGVAT